MIDFILVLINLCWLIGLIALPFSDVTQIILKETSFRRTGWRKYQRGYSISTIKKIIKDLDDRLVINKLERKIKLRRLGYILLILGTILVPLRLYLMGE